VPEWSWDPGTGLFYDPHKTNPLPSTTNVSAFNGLAGNRIKDAMKKTLIQPKTVIFILLFLMIVSSFLVIRFFDVLRLNFLDRELVFRELRISK
jgi:hypothetical protein